uniref:Retrovirus-related Pol polyprotein from transposon TNT 1-94 n=1 Tax=Tanacetum cinerariifolium TaxID=118510 RepID=A0A699GN27_TANCI|nr:retrovirus-related Pol polyprotein from transposon TNT 1-94 [Tanacetum cinerariifolium]
MLTEFIAEVPSASALQVLRRLGSIFTSMYTTVQKLKKALGWSFGSAWELLSESPRNTTDSSVAVTDSSTTNYNSADEILVCSIPLPPLKKLDGAKPISGPKALKSILRSKSTFKAEALKDVTINELSSAPAKGNKSSSASKVHLAPADHLGKFDEKADNGYLFGYSLVSKAFRVFNTRRQQTKETYHITFDECPDAIKFSQSSVDNIIIAKTKRYPADEYLHPYEPSQSLEDTSIHKTIPIPIPPLPIPSMVTPAPQDRWSKDKHIEILNIRIFLAFATYMNFIAYQMEVKSAFLNGKLKEEVYVKQTLDFESSTLPNHVCKLDKVLYGIKQAPRAWKSTSGACQFLRGKLVCWSAKKQQSVAMSSAKAEYVAVPIFCDNTNAIAISNNPVLHSRTKHIDIRYHFIRDHVFKGDIDLHFITTQYQFVDIFTKPLEESTFKRLTVELGRVRGEIGITTFRNALKAHYLPHSTMYVPSPSITTIDYAKIIWYDLIHKLNKKTKEKSIPFPRFFSLLLEHMSPEYENEELTINPTQVFSVHNLTLKPKPKERPFTDHTKAICNLVVPVDSKAPKPSSHTKKTPQGKKPGAKTGLRSKISSKHTSESKTEASISQTGQSKIETQSSSAKEKSSSHPSHPTPMVGKMHKDAQQKAGGLTSLGATSEEGAHPQLSSSMDEGTKSTSYDHIFARSNPNVLVDKTKFIGDGLKIVRTESGAKEVRKAKETLTTSQDVPEDTSVPHPPSPILAQIHKLMAQVHLLQSQKKELEQIKAAAEAKDTSLKAKPSYPNTNQLTTLLVTFLKPELAKFFASHDLASCLPSELKELPSKVTKLKILDLPHLISLIQETLKTLDSFLGILNKVTNTLNRFATMVENALRATIVNVPLAGKAIASPANAEVEEHKGCKYKPEE